MKKINIIAPAMLMVMLFSSIVLADIQTIYPTDDATVSEDPHEAGVTGGYPDAVKVQSATPQPGFGYYNMRGLGGFDRTLIACAPEDVESATLVYFVQGYSQIDATPIPYSVHTVYDQTWSESTVNWYNQPCGEDFTDSTNCNLTPEDTVDVGTGWKLRVEWDVTNAVKTASGDRISFIVKDATESLSLMRGREFFSKDNTYALDSFPRLEIVCSASAMSGSAPQTIVYVNPNQTITLPQITASVEIDDDNSDCRRMRLYGFWEMNNTNNIINGTIVPRLYDETFPNPPLTFTFGSVGSEYDYVATITSVEIEGCSTPYDYTERLDSTLSIHYIVQDPTSPPVGGDDVDEGLIQQLVNNILNGIKAWMCENWGKFC